MNGAEEYTNGNGTDINQTNLTSITIPASVTNIGNDAFSGCTALERMEVDAANPNYASHSGVLCNKGKLAMVHVPRALRGTVLLPNTLRHIPAGAFENCTQLTSVNMEGSAVVSIGADAFLNTGLWNEKKQST